MAEYCNDKFLMVEDNEDSFRMWQGLVGPHYTPIVDNDGTLRWTNDGMLPNPDSVNIRGPQGAGLTIGGIRETAEELPAQAPPGVLWLVGTESPFESYSFIGGEWIDLGLCYVGPAGPPGPQGDDYSLTPADKSEIAAEAEQLLLNDLNNNPLPISRGGTSAQTLAGAKENLGITDLEEQIGDTPLATDAQDIRGAINELVGDLGSLDFDTDAQNVTGAVNELVDKKVSKSGDTMTGNLNINNNAPGIIAKKINKSSADDVSANDNSVGYRVTDKNGNIVAIFTDRYLASGNAVGAWLGGARVVNGSNSFNNLYLLIDASGNPFVLLEAAAWRKALEICYTANETMTITASTDITGHINANSTTVYLTVTTSKSMENISSITVTALSGWFAGPNGALNGSAANVNYVTSSDYSLATSKLDNYHVRIAITKTSAFSNSVNNGAVNYFGTLTLKFT